MRTVEEIRRARLAQLVDEFGSYAALNRRLTLNERDSTLNQVALSSPNSRTKKPKTMGSDMARALEGACTKERGWMDNDPDLWPFPEDIRPSAVKALPANMREHVVGALRGFIMTATLPTDPTQLRSGADAFPLKIGTPAPAVEAAHSATSARSVKSPTRSARKAQQS